MFTGIVEAVATVERVEQHERGRRLRVETSELGALPLGASISIDGACLTVVASDEGGFEVDVVSTTLEKTIAGGYEPGTRVNLERALAASGRLDGHLVQGHVDGVGSVAAVSEQGDGLGLDVRLPSEVAALTVRHGSVAVNGVSLTVADLLAEDICRVVVIPHTRAATNLGRLSPGDPVNIEGDLIGKYVGTILARRAGDTPS